MHLFCATRVSQGTACRLLAINISHISHPFLFFCRLADVNLVSSQHSQEPVYLLHPGGEYHIRVSLFHPPSGQRVQVQGVDWIRIGVANGQAVTLDIETEQG